jgi:ATP-dependent Zn protease
MAPTTNNKDKKRKMIPMAPKPKNVFGNVFFYIFIMFGLMMIFNFFNTGAVGEEIPVNKVISYINEDKVQNVVVAGDTLEILLKDGTKLVSQKESGVSFDDMLANSNVDVSKVAGEIKVEHRVTHRSGNNSSTYVWISSLHIVYDL